MGIDERKTTIEKTVTDSGYVKGHSHGTEGDFEYYPSSEKEKHGYEAGLEEWLKNVDISGVSASEIATPVTLKGFFYTLARQGMLKLDNCPFEPDSKEAEKYIESYISEVLSRFDETIQNYPQHGDKVGEWKSNFERGLQIAASYLDKNFKAFCDDRAKMLYGLDFEGMPISRQNKYFEIHKNIQSDLVVLVNDNPFSVSMEYFDMLMDLYDDKKSEVYNLLDSGEHNKALQICDYLGLLIQYNKINEDDLRALISQKEGYGQHFDESEDSEYHAEQLSTYRINEKIGEVVNLQQLVVKRMGDTVLDYNERMKSYVSLERYEEAGKLRDELVEYRKEMDSINAWLREALPEFSHMI